ncbi:MAG: sodium-translocating pyrophosphatase [Bacteroidetes bacterium]|nr:sodium-translocating pyrophosphatase [Bacteroidota bacterium]
MANLIYLIPVFGIIGLAYMAITAMWVTKQDAGDSKMAGIASHIAEGAMAFLKAEYRILAIYVLLAGTGLGILSQVSKVASHSHILIVAAFVTGCFFSALAGFIGMKIATKANVRTTQAARTSLAKALKVSFGGGTVMGLGVAGLAVLGLSSLFAIFYTKFMSGSFANGGTEEMMRVLEVLTGFSVGAESIALFARVGGGIYTKAADVGADLVGKVEAGIPEDDPRNPATIADNVGDNVGDVAGMGADLFGSYVATVLASMVLGNYIIKDNPGLTDNFGGIGAILLPITIAGTGIIASIIGTWFVNVKDDGEATTDKVQKALNTGNWSAIILALVAAFFLIKYMLPASMHMSGFNHDITSMDVFYAVCIGMTVGALISLITEYYTGLGKKPVLSIVYKSATGAATNIIAGLGNGMLSTAFPVILFAGAIWGSYHFAGFYGVGIAAASMMATTGMQLAIDAFGPIADNAGGIAEMSELPKEVREKTDVLDSVGNTTAAIGKGFAIASAALTALALFAAYVSITGIPGINIFNAKVLAALFIGAMIPVVFSALAMNSVGKAAMDMVNEVRRQFRTIPGIMEGTGKPEYGRCVEISTKAALREMLAPGAITIITPLIVGLVMGAEALGAYMAGVTVSGVLWAIFQNNAGGAWDNAKKSFEKGIELEVNGKKEMFYKKSEPHKAAVVGDTVGDPFKDTSGPSMNILIKLSSLVGLTIAPLIAIDHPLANVVGTSAEKIIATANAMTYADIKTLSGTYQMDDSHSFVEFSLSHFLTTAKGNIALDTNYENKLVMTGDVATSSVDLALSTNSINTMNTDRDEHLKSEDYFDAKKFPTIKFVSTSVKENKEGFYHYTAIGNLTIKGATKPVEIPFNYLGEYKPKSKDGKTRPSIYTFDGEFKINRVDFGVGEKSVALGEEVTISFSIETRKK